MICLLVVLVKHYSLLDETYRLITDGWPRHMLPPPLPVLLWAFSYLPVGMLGCVMCLTLLLFGLHPGKAAWHRHLIQALDFVRLGPGWLLGCPIQTSPNCGPVSDSSLGRKFEGINHQSIVWCLILLSYQYSCLFGEIVVFCARVIWLSPV